MQMKMETVLAQSFDKLFGNFTKATEVYTKRIIYICDRKCSAENAHEYGLTSAFLLSVLSERKFVVKTALDYSLYDFYKERNYTWKLNVSDATNIPGQMILSQSANQKTYLTDLHLLEGKLHKMDFEAKFKRESVTLSSNHNWIPDLRRHSRTMDKMPWLFKTHACDVNRLVHFGLFRVPNYVRDNINSQILDKIGDNKLICFHGNAKEQIKTYEILNFLVAKYHSSVFKIYVSNVNSKAYFDIKDNIENKLNKRVVQFNTDKIYQRVKQEKHSREDFKKFQNILDVYILVMCDVLITMESPNGILAAHLRRNSEGLFCYRKGMIFPCTRELIAGSFRDFEHVPVSLDPFHLFLNIRH